MMSHKGILIYGMTLCYVTFYTSTLCFLAGARGGRELELEVKLEEMKGMVEELERKRAALKNKVLILRQQLDAKGKRHTPYDHVQSRISTVRPYQHLEKFRCCIIKPNYSKLFNPNSEKQYPKINLNSLIRKLKFPNQELRSCEIT